MATIVSTLADAQDHRSAKEFSGNQTRVQGVMMTSAMPDIDMIKSSIPEYPSNDLLVHDINGSRPLRSNIRKGIPSLPHVWNKRPFARGERRQPTAKSRNPLGPQQTPQQSSQQSAEEPKVHHRPLVNQAPPEPVQLNAEGLEVSIPLQLKERLKTWNLSSSLQLTADENAVFESTDSGKLKQFSQFLHQNGSALFHGLPSRNLVLTLVAVTGPSASWRCICIKGLTKETEITSFHAILSQRSVRAHYKPWRLCYDKSLVETAASVATHQTNMSEAPETLCGTLVRTEEPGKGAWISTIGGIIEVAGIFFAMTSAHHPSDANSTSDESIPDFTSSSPGTSVADTLVEKAVIDTDVEPALIIDTWKEQVHQGDLAKTSTSHPVLLSKPPQTTNQFFWPDLNTTAIEGPDWRLLTVDKVHQLPNCIPFQQTAARSSQGTQDIAPHELISHAVPRSPRYLKAFATQLSKRSVYILAGVSGVCPGMLSGNMSFLNLRNEEPRLVWSVKLDTGFELRKGDSGSWVIDAETNDILGYVVAISAGSAYLISLHNLFQQILHCVEPEPSIGIPSPFTLLVRLARYHFAVEPPGQKPLSDYYASEALSPDVLNTKNDQAMRLLKSAIAHGESRSQLMRIICSVEENLWPLLGSFSTWSSEQQRNLDQDLVPILTRMENRPPPPDPKLVTSVGPGPNALVVDIEKGKTHQEKPTPTQNPLERHVWREMKRDLLNMLTYLHWPASNPTREFAPLKWGYALVSVLSYITALGYGVAGGVAAAATFAHMQHLPQSREILGNGAIGGLIITATFHVQVLVTVLIKYVSGFQIDGIRIFAKITGIILLLLILQFGLSFARTLLTALTLISRFHIQNSRPVYIGATLAALPLIFEALFLLFTPLLSFICLMSVPGLNALAGFVFAVICHQYGYDFSRYNSAAAAATVYGAIHVGAMGILHLEGRKMLERLQSLRKSMDVRDRARNPRLPPTLPTPQQQLLR